MSVYNALNTALYTKLQAGTALTALLAGTTSIYYQQAPEGSILDYVVWSFPAGGPLNDYPHDSRDYVAFIRGYSDTGPAAAGSIDAQISTLLHRGSVTVSGYTNYWLAREEDFSLVEHSPKPGGKQIWMAGANYRIRIDT